MVESENVTIGFVGEGAGLFLVHPLNKKTVRDAMNRLLMWCIIFLSLRQLIYLKYKKKFVI